MCKKNEKQNKIILIIFSTFIMGIIPFVLFFTSIKEKIYPENRIFVLMFFEVLFFIFFSSLLFSKKKEGGEEELKGNAQKIIFSTIGKYFIIAFGGAFLFYVFSFLEKRIAVFAALIPLFIFWIYDIFKK